MKDTHICKLAIAYSPVAALSANSRNARTHSKRQIRQIAASIRTFGFNNPIIIDKNAKIVAGHGIFYLQAGEIVDNRDAPDHENVAGAPARVEVVTGDQQNNFARGAPRDQQEQPHHDKKEQELKAIEEHDA